MSLTFIDFFSGIGGFRLGMEMAGHTCLGHCEIDKYANASYINMHSPKESEWFATDIKEVNPEEIPRANAWCFGFPCQDISVCGNQRGFEGERSSLFFTVTRLIRTLKEEAKPSILFIENVKNLLSVNRGYDFLKLLIELDEIGYDAEWQIINSRDYVPQNRERIFIIGHLRGRGGGEVFPISRGDGENTLKQLIGGSQGMRVYDSNGISCCLSANGGGQGAKTGLYTIDKNKEEVRAVLTPNRLNKRQNGRRIKNDGEPMFTLTTQDRHGVLVGKRVRRLTPKECFRLQGFSDEFYEKASEVCSEAQLYKQAGNSVTVNVIYEIAKRL